MAASEQTLSSLHEALTTALLERIKDKTATAADMAVARGILKDNRITCAPADDNAIGELEQKLAARKAKRQAPRLVAVTPKDDIAGAEADRDFMVSHG